MALRICAGTFKGKHLKIPPPAITRPSSDRLRQAIFNILTNHVSLENLCILDGFAGSGSLGLEALSRGAAEVVFCENNPTAQTSLKENILSTIKTNHNNITIFQDIFKIEFLKPFDVIFLDPPYDKQLEIKAIKYLEDKKLIAKKGFIIIEQRKHSPLITFPNFISDTPRIYGKCQVTFLHFLH